MGQHLHASTGLSISALDQHELAPRPTLTRQDHHTYSQSGKTLPHIRSGFVLKCYPSAISSSGEEFSTFLSYSGENLPSDSNENKDFSATKIKRTAQLLKQHRIGKRFLHRERMQPFERMKEKCVCTCRHRYMLYRPAFNWTKDNR